MRDLADSKTRSRRRLLRKLAQGGAAIGTAAALPERWSRPVVDAVIVPLHAQTSPAFIDPASLAGSWTGSWVDQVAGTNGPASMTVVVDTSARTFSIQLDLNGPVLGGADPPPQPFTGSYTLTGATICCQVVPRFGVPDITISPTGALSGAVAPLPEIGTVQVSGTVSSTTVAIHFTAAVGPSALARAGTLTLSK